MTETRSRTAHHGFTLIEMMIVILIIGILLAIALPAFVHARERTKATSCQHNMKQILGAKERWAMDYNKGATDTPLMSDLVKPGVYLRNAPICPSAGTYTVGRMDELPGCSIGGIQGEYNAHVLP